MHMWYYVDCGVRTETPTADKLYALLGGKLVYDAALPVDFLSRWHKTQATRVEPFAFRIASRGCRSSVALVAPPPSLSYTFTRDLLLSFCVWRQRVSPRSKCSHQPNTPSLKPHLSAPTIFKSFKLKCAA